ncbi:MAG: holo-[acyl-carrier-protein] synthase [Firmicutes bacterium GWF2_51_9]|jgi:holo-[acyl-carrier protein] synthase|nr:holo-ACP synthase [Erysipelotrichaceae bacterium]OGS54221.1 MAG: holo-[acyl-carrier-protein] synthase [Firmicutes bacterium GWF2_51_9]OGS59136.1 MAG: holo-[acyl-carrier-protein] synthase [Firmicutes bacterium GWE2_51_13]HAO61584.1 holo-[acyl-carrier-protein] synthase [Erysipelotrichaceae bacterium]HBZ41240.1 holo-[acyl-carrier-protein] synthase [Erysipelotrichaceae bacterium]
MIAGIGCDIVELRRFKEDPDRLARRILTQGELAIYQQLPPIRIIEWLAGRFAAKEAIVKALDTPTTITRIEIQSDENGKPFCRLEGYVVHLSIAHEKEYAIAYAIVEKG